MGWDGCPNVAFEARYVRYAYYSVAYRSLNVGKAVAACRFVGEPYGSHPRNGVIVVPKILGFQAVAATKKIPMSMDF